MKLSRNITQQNNINTKTVQRFGQAKLVRHRNGRHELIGGSAADRAMAKEWISLFAHEIVISAGGPQLDTNCRISCPKEVKRFVW